MEVTKFGQKDSENTIMCLGGFDSVHLGHRKIIQKAESLKEKYGAKTCVFTFCNDFSGYTKKSKGLVYTFPERLERLKRLNPDEVCVLEFDRELGNTAPEDFLRKITKTRKISAFVCGPDYRFGKNAEGDTALLKNFCVKNGIDLYVCDFVSDKKGEKISTTGIKKLLSLGKIEEANRLLGERYSLSGKIEKGRQQGRSIGFPTANIPIDKDKFLIKQGVYATEVLVGGKTYKAITNVGCAPTFGCYDVLCECYIKGFEGCLYGRDMTVCFDSYMRDIKKFENASELKNQLDKDLLMLK